MGINRFRSISDADGWTQHISLNAHSRKEALQRAGLKTSISGQPSLIQSLEHAGPSAFKNNSSLAFLPLASCSFFKTGVAIRLYSSSA